MAGLVALFSLFFAVAVCDLAEADLQEKVTVKTASGQDLVLSITRPEGPLKYPALVLAPGPSCKMVSPILEEISNDFASNKYVVVRFDWGFCGSGATEPSKDYHDELEELRSAIAFVKKHSNVETSQIFLGGKSLGSIVGYSIFQSDEELKGLLVLTPVCTWRWNESGEVLSQPVNIAERNYPDLGSVKRPILFLLGSGDSVCTLPMLYEFLGHVQARVSTMVLAGDHNFNVTPPGGGSSAERRNSENHAFASRAALNWVQTLLGN